MSVAGQPWTETVGFHSFGPSSSSVSFEIVPAFYFVQFWLFIDLSPCGVGYQLCWCNQPECVLFPIGRRTLASLTMRSVYRWEIKKRQRPSCWPRWRTRCPATLVSANHPGRPNGHLQVKVNQIIRRPIDERGPQSNVVKEWLRSPMACGATVWLKGRQSVGVMDGLFFFLSSIASID